MWGVVWTYEKVESAPVDLAEVTFADIICCFCMDVGDYCSFILRGIVGWCLYCLALSGFVGDSVRKGRGGYIADVEARSILEDVQVYVYG